LRASFAGAASGAAHVPWANAKLSRVGANQPVAKRKSLCAHPDPGGFMKTNLKLMTCIANASYGDFPSFASVAYVLRFLLFVFSLMNPYQIETEPVRLYADRWPLRLSPQLSLINNFVQRILDDSLRTELLELRDQFTDNLFVDNSLDCYPS